MKKIPMPNRFKDVKDTFAKGVNRFSVIESYRWPAKCHVCGHRLVWGADFDPEDYGMDPEEEEGTIIRSLHCPHCGSDYEVIERREDRKWES